jgi:hypothetical protein
MNDKINTDTPNLSIFDQVVAERGYPGALRPVEPTPVITALATEALSAPREEVIPPKTVEKSRRTLSSDGYSSSARHVVETINNAIEAGKHDIEGRLFVDYVKDHKDYMTSHEFPSLLQKTQAL